MLSSSETVRPILDQTRSYIFLFDIYGSFCYFNFLWWFFSCPITTVGSRPNLERCLERHFLKKRTRSSTRPPEAYFHKNSDVLLLNFFVLNWNFFAFIEEKNTSLNHFPFRVICLCCKCSTWILNNFWHCQTEKVCWIYSSGFPQ